MRTIFAILIAGLMLAGTLAAQSIENPIYRFDLTHGAFPGDLIQDANGNLFGTAGSGGIAGSGCPAAGCGVAFELSPSSGGAWTYTVLYSFQGGADSGIPDGRLLMDAKGNLYGAAGTGGAHGLGTVYKLSPQSNGTWTEAILHSFPENSLDGFSPSGDLTMDAAGNIYGTTEQGSGGVVYELIAQKSGVYGEGILHTFSQEGDGIGIDYGVEMDAHGNLFGASRDGGTHNLGIVFELSGAPNWVYNIIYDFQPNDAAGGNPGILTIGPDGNVYGPASDGGANFNGTIFQLSLGSSGWQAKAVYAFPVDSLAPPARVVFAPKGDIIAATPFAGTACYGGCGSAYALLATSGGQFTDKVFHYFSSALDGSQPTSILIGKNNRLYGATTNGGGRFGYGTVYEIIP